MNLKVANKKLCQVCLFHTTLVKIFAVLLYFIDHQVKLMTILEIL